MKLLDVSSAIAESYRGGRPPAVRLMKGLKGRSCVERSLKRAPPSTRSVCCRARMGSRAARQRKITVTDGPFTESRKVIGGWQS